MSTAFRKSQARTVLEGIVRALAPYMQTADGLRAAVQELAADRALWAELELVRAPLPKPTATATTPQSPIQPPPKGMP